MITPSTQNRDEAASTRSFSPSSKIDLRHLSRTAMVYVRQSSARQVMENVESTRMQYALVDRAAYYGWERDRIEVIDEDLGVSGAGSAERVGFRKLLAEISMGHVGIVFGIEMSRLARNCRDWHHLLELCAVFDALLGDADGIYDPRQYNDRLLLGLKGTMSEAELHILRNRLLEGRNNKARRGEFFAHAPIGYVRTETGMALDPDDQVRRSVELVFEKFEELGSATAVLKWFRRHEIKMGVRRSCKAGLGPVEWRLPNRGTIRGILRHPAYAGAYVFGRSIMDPKRRIPGKRGSGRRLAKRDEWQVFLRDKLPSYISWDRWERNQQRLRENSTSFGVGAPRGASLIAGRVRCGKCGSRMAVSYTTYRNAYFKCCDANLQRAEPICQSFSGRSLESLVSELVLVATAPASIELSLQAADAIEADRRKLEEYHLQSVERAAYEVELARRRYEGVDPDNRLVAAELEREWESRLKAKREAEESLDRIRSEHPRQLTAEQRTSIEDLAKDFAGLWNAPTTTDIDRQAIVRLLIDDIIVEVINDTERLSVVVCWAGGFESRHEIRRPVSSFEHLDRSEELADRIGELYNQGYPLVAIAQQLNAEGYKPARGDQFTKTSMGALCRMLRRKGIIAATPEIPPYFWRASQLSTALGIGKATLSGWRRRGWVQVRKVGSRWLYWADEAEFSRLERLANHPLRGSRPTCPELLVPASKMPSLPGGGD